MMVFPVTRPSDGKARAANSARAARTARRSTRVKPESSRCGQFSFSGVFTSLIESLPIEVRIHTACCPGHHIFEIPPLNMAVEHADVAPNGDVSIQMRTEVRLCVATVDGHPIVGGIPGIVEPASVIEGRIRHEWTRGRFDR